MANPKDVFVVRGHDHGMKVTVARLLSKLGLNPIILYEQAEPPGILSGHFGDVGESTGRFSNKFNTLVSTQGRHLNSGNCLARVVGLIVFGEVDIPSPSESCDEPSDYILTYRPNQDSGPTDKITSGSFRSAQGGGRQSGRVASHSCLRWGRELVR
jgi:hypothetical protein